jgi:hypothetical protein
MIPSILDRQIRQGAADFVRTTFSITTPSMAKMVDNLCDEPDHMFRGRLSALITGVHPHAVRRGAEGG